MIPIVGKYQQERSQNIEEYLQTLGVPFIARKMAAKSNPRLEITNNGDEWVLKTVTMMRTQICRFNLGSEYEEAMPFGVTLKSTSKLEGRSLITISVDEDGHTATRKYDFSEDGAVLTMSHDRSDLVAKRYFKRIE